MRRECRRRFRRRCRRALAGPPVKRRRTRGRGEPVSQPPAAGRTRVWSANAAGPGRRHRSQTGLLEPRGRRARGARLGASPRSPPSAHSLRLPTGPVHHRGASTSGSFPRHTGCSSCRSCSGSRRCSGSGAIPFSPAGRRKASASTQAQGPRRSAKEGLGRLAPDHGTSPSPGSDAWRSDTPEPLPSPLDTPLPRPLAARPHPRTPGSPKRRRLYHLKAKTSLYGGFSSADILGPITERSKNNRHQDHSPNPRG